MDPNRLTQKSQEAAHDAQTKALRFGHNEVDGERLLEAPGGDTSRLRADLEAELARRPRFSRPGVAPGQVAVTQRLARLLDAAEQESKRLKDDYVSVEHLIIALLAEGQQSAAGRLLASAGLTRDGFLQA